ncbi:hypothetical protein VNO77_28381 [Canavalia gladiata]|uniref:Uncharacterized protein n=1 Tax=Canavalia gladiata TaxID=3824 RepID=A0AAN9Q767_CANGL
MAPIDVTKFCSLGQKLQLRVEKISYDETKCRKDITTMIQATVNRFSIAMLKQNNDLPLTYIWIEQFSNIGLM